MAQIRDLPPKKRMENIWYYYKWHILIGIFLIVVAVSCISSIFTNPRYIFNMSLVGFCDTTKNNEVANLENDITKLIGKSNKRDTAGIDIYQLSSTSNTLNDIEPAYRQKLSIKMAAKDVDILVVSKDDFNDFIKQGSFLKLDSLKNLNINNSNYKLIKSDSSIYGISIEGNKALEKIGYNTKDKVIGIMANTKQREKSQKVLEWLLKYQ